MDLSFLEKLQRVIDERKSADPEKSYTARLISAGQRKIGSKLMEEAAETVTAALSESKERLIEESADLLYHLMVLLSSRGTSLKDVVEALKKRHG